jgi:CheY-like chemotaxis protein
MRHYLLVDDNRPFADNLAEIIADQGDRVTVATSGPEALELVRSTRFDAVLTDMRMPGMSGAELVHRLRRVDPGLPAIVVTAYIGDDALAMARAEGLLAALQKPIDLPHLLELLGQARRDGLVAIVEDDDALADNLGEALAARGFSAVMARNVFETDRLSGLGPFAAIVDLRMPGGPSGEALRRLEAIFPEIRIFIVSAFPADLRERNERWAIYPKPFETPQLLDAVAAVFAGRCAA